VAFSLGLQTYLTVSNRLMGFAERKLQARLEAGKEDPERVGERRGEASVPRPKGLLVWFHAASVGESLSLLLLIEQMLDEFPDVNVLVTTGTRSSSTSLCRSMCLDRKRAVAQPDHPDSTTRHADGAFECPDVEDVA